MGQALPAKNSKKGTMSIGSTDRQCEAQNFLFPGLLIILVATSLTSLLEGNHGALMDL